MAEYERCLESVQLGPLALCNRIFVSAHTTNFGRDVSILSPAPGLFWEINSYSQMLIVERLKKAGVAFYTMAKIREWDGNAVRFTDGCRSDRWIRDVGTVCVASPGVPRENPLAELTEGYDATVIGDVLAPRDLLQVMYQGHDIGRRL